MASPNLTYLSPQVGEIIRASYQNGHNQIQVRFKSDISLNFYEARVTKINEDYDIGVGGLAYQWAGSLAANVEHSYTISVSPELFPEDGTYRISLYAREALENTWDVTYLFITAEGQIFKPVDADGLEVIRKDEI